MFLLFSTNAFNSFSNDSKISFFGSLKKRATSIISKAPADICSLIFSAVNSNTGLTSISALSLY